MKRLEENHRDPLHS
jgi:hypothetical protein